MPAAHRFRHPAASMLAAAMIAGGATGAAAETVKVRITGFEEIEGDVHAALYDDSEAFPKPGQMLTEKKVVLDGPVAEVAFDELAAGRRYAVAVYHDANGNDEFDQGIFGIPLERYGFSREPRVFLRAPQFDESALTLPPEGLVIEIDLSK